MGEWSEVDADEQDRVEGDEGVTEGEGRREKMLCAWFRGVDVEVEVEYGDSSSYCDAKGR